MKNGIKFVSVMAVSAALGISLGLAIHSAIVRPAKAAPAPQPEQPDQAVRPAPRRSPVELPIPVEQLEPHPLRIAAEIGEVVRRPHGRRWHSSLRPSEVNEGDPGVLLVRGTYQVGTPNPPGDDQPFDVVVRVKDRLGNVIIDQDHIGSGVDTRELADWEQTFSAAYRLPPGQYVVDMLLHDPNLRLRRPDGTVIGPLMVGHYRRVMTVR